MAHPTPDEVANDLAGLWPTLWWAFEVATDSAQQYFDVQGEDVEPCLFASLARYGMRMSLAAEGFNLLDLGNNGIQIEYQGYSIKVLKSDDGGLPAPGPSQAKQDFYQQMFKFNEEVDVILPPEHYRNLVICWDVDGDYMATHLTLYCPKNGDESTARALWSRAIPHPGENGARKKHDLSTVEPEAEEDLDIRARDHSIKHTGTGEDD